MKFLKYFIGFDPVREREFPGQQPGEVVELMTGRHWMSLGRFFLEIGLVAIVFVSFLFSASFHELAPLTRLTVITVTLALIIHLICFRLYNYFLKVILITNFRVIDIRHTVFLKREREVIPMLHIQDFRYQQTGVFPRLFHYGTLVVLGSSTDVKYVFRYLPRINKIHHVLGEVHQKALQNRAHNGNAVMPSAPVPPPEG